MTLVFFAVFLLPGHAICLHDRGLYREMLSFVYCLIPFFLPNFLLLGSIHYDCFAAFNRHTWLSNIQIQSVGYFYCCYFVGVAS